MKLCSLLTLLGLIACKVAKAQNNSTPCSGTFSTFYSVCEDGCRFVGHGVWNGTGSTENGMQIQNSTCSNESSCGYDCCPFTCSIIQVSNDKVEGASSSRGGQEALQWMPTLMAFLACFG